WVLFRNRMELGNLLQFRRGVLLGTVLFLGYLLQTLGLVHTTASRSGVFTSLAVVFVPLLLALGKQRRPRGGVLLAVGLAMCGIVLMNGAGGDTGAATLTGDLMTIGCALAFAVQILLMDRVPTAGHTWTLTFWQVATVAVLAAACLPFRGPLALVWTPGLVVALLFCGLLATVIALALQIRYQREIAPEKAAVIYTLEPVFAGGFAFVIAGDRLGGHELLGGLLLVLGLWAVELDRARLRAWRAWLFG
ncbi:MAG: DMT family transporter, partial [Flavobacteriales bacterium]|nr:DMT family transporter [Flavobacteriales bacterium]